MKPVRRPGLVVAVLALAGFMSSLDLFIVNLAFPSIAAEFPGTGLTALSWVLNAYTITFAAVLVPAGRWADRTGRRQAFVVGLLVFTLGSVLCGLAPGVGLLVAARLVQAVGAGVMVPASLSLLLAVIPPAGRARAIGSWSAIGALGAGLGPVIGGLLVEIDWRWVFWVNIPVGMAGVLAARRLLPESRDPGVRTRPDLVGAALIAAVVGLVALALVEGPGWGWLSARFVGALALAVVGMTLLVRRSTRHPAPVVEAALMRSAGFSASALASVLYYAGFGAFVLCNVEFLTSVWHYSPVRAGLAIAPGPLTVLPFARLVAPRLVQKFGAPGRVAALGCLVGVAAQALWLVQITGRPAYATTLLPAQLLGGAGVGLTIPSLIGAGSAALPAARFGTGSGVLNMARQVGAVLGVAGLVAVLAAQPGDPLQTFRWAVALVIGFFAAAAATCGLLLCRRPQPAPAVTATAVPPAPPPEPVAAC